MNRNAKHGSTRWYALHALRWGWRFLHAALALAGWVGLAIGLMVMGQ